MVELLVGWEAILVVMEELFLVYQSSREVTFSMEVDLVDMEVSEVLEHSEEAFMEVLAGEKTGHWRKVKEEKLTDLILKKTI